VGGKVVHAAAPYADLERAEYAAAKSP
jgi:hypothetical protein